MSKININDIYMQKNELRRYFIQIRNTIIKSEKENYDEKIYNKIISSQLYINSKTIMTYISTEIEVDTKKLILKSFYDKKTVAVPKCAKGTSDMEFFIIKSLDDLNIGSFSILEPDETKCQKLINFNDAVCIIPGLAYDNQGYRLGYGKGYYDRYLSKHFELKKVGICYDLCVVSDLIKDRFDIPVQCIISDKNVIIL